MTTARRWVWAAILWIAPLPTALAAPAAAPSATSPGESTTPSLPAAGPPKPFSLLVPPRPPLTGEPEATTYELRRATDGSGDLVYEGAGFGARVARDGAVTFRDKHLTALSLLAPWLPLPTPEDRPSLQSVLRRMIDNGKSRRRGPPPSPSSPRPSDDPALIIPNGTSFRPDPREVCTYPHACYFQADLMLVNVTGKMDLTDELMRIHGQDPYRYAKARFMAETRELRAHLAARAQADDLRAAAVELPGRLEAIAGDERLSVAERRAILEALRDEVDATTPEGQALRRRIGELLKTRFEAPDAGP